MEMPFSEGAVTRARREHKLVLSRRDSVSLCARLAGTLKVPAGAPTQITCVYYDAPGLPLAARALATPDDCVKLRTKEYFPDVSGSPLARVVVELKRECAELTCKSRWWVPRDALGDDGGDAGEVLRLLQGRLSPVLAVSYVRQVFQRFDSWRVTVDWEICFHPIDAQRALGPRRLSRSELAAPFWCQEGVIVELKHLEGSLPAELEALAAAPARYSKFVEGMKRRAKAAQEKRGCSSTSRESTAAERPPSPTGSPHA